MSPTSPTATLPTTLAATRGYRAGAIGAAVLVVEDDEMLGDMLVMLLEAEGYVTAIARDGETAVTMARRIKPALITLDLHLPLLTGHGVLRRLAASRLTSRIPVVVLSSDVGELIPTRQVKRVLVKPNGVTELVEAIRNIVPEYRRTA
jgi:two-component system, OmpR family, phosphate regulon response regulator PhoB